MQPCKHGPVWYRKHCLFQFGTENIACLASSVFGFGSLCNRYNLQVQKFDKIELIVYEKSSAVILDLNCFIFSSLKQVHY
ncbi:hypothetical protein VNO77_39451 [Canavalia gladiata]|uniref:Uncharacterized protein n=1 Tax=Canavalia gladiata TaxID=3824 RepID=A0AAN9PZS8_CANGL